MPFKSFLEKISRGTVEIINPESLEKKLASCSASGRPLRVKAGFDPTAPDIHLGHCVLLRKLRQFQDLGHEVFFLIGDFTAQVGDPSGRESLRPKMSPALIAENAKTYEKQVFKILDKAKTKVVFNSSWLGDLSAQQILELTAFSTVAQMLARADFKKRFDEGREISLLEFIYPLLQGYDSVHLKADIELGGADQRFNLLMGRHLQEAMGQDPQVVIMTPLLEGLDGVKKMSKSLGNYIGITEPPREIFGKIMSISDELMYRYYEILTDKNMTDVRALHPKEGKMILGEEIVAQFYSRQEAVVARQEFEKIFSAGQVPDEMVEYKVTDDRNFDVLDVVVSTGLASSRNEARRLLKQGSISHEGRTIVSEKWKAEKGVLKIGKRRFLRLV